MPSRSGSRPLPTWAGPVAAAVFALAVGVLLVVNLTGDEEGDGSGDDVVVQADATPGAQVENTTSADPVDEATGDAQVDDTLAQAPDAEATVEAPVAATASEAEPDDPAVEEIISANPLSIALLVADAGALTPQELSLTGMLEGNGHTVTPFTVTVEPIVNAVNNPTIDVLLFSPSFEFSTLYHPAQPDSLPMLDMAKFSWYRRYVLPWSDEISGPRFSGVGETATEIFYEDADVIAWDGQEVGPVQLLTAPRWAGEAPMRLAMEHSTDGAQYFLRHLGDTGAESTLGVYLPPGSTITEPAPEVGAERRVTSVVPWIGLLVFVDDGGDGNQYAELTPAGESLFEAALQHLMNP